MTFLKWAGSKRQLVPKLKELLPPDFQNRRYIEPMVGGGSLFFALQPKSAILADANAALIMAYHDVKHSAGELLRWLESWKIADYNVIREYYREAMQNGHLETVEQSARFIWLNKMCFTPGSQVLLEGETWRAAEEMAVGDRLWNGRVVQEVLSRHYHGAIRRIRVQGSPWVASVTEDHPILSVKGKGVARQEKRTAAELLREMDFHAARDLKVGDYVFLPTAGAWNDSVDWREFWPKDAMFGPQIRKRRLVKNPRNTDVARLLGYYAANGHIQYQANHKDGSRGRITAVVFTFHSDTRDSYIADIETICWKLFRVRPKVTRGVGKKFSIQVNSAQIATFIRTLVPGQSWAKRIQERKTKRLHTTLMTLPVEIQLELLKGWLRGDGGLRHKKYTSELTGTCTVLPMARQMYRLAQRCGLKPSWRISRPKRPNATHFDGSQVDNTMANISFSGDDVQTLGFEILKKRRTCEQRRLVGEYLCVRIKDIVDLHYDGSVHNVEVDGDHRICVDGVISHNCFNGIYRVNKDGVFNVPKGSRKVLPDMGPALATSSKALQHAELRIAGFEDTIHTATPTDFVYFDPPYLGEDTFTAYTAGKFDFAEHARLRWVCGQLDQKGVPWMLSSSDHHKIRTLYDEYDIVEVKARRAINSDGAGRGEVTELVIRNY